jgi:hypothetical protein
VVNYGYPYAFAIHELGPHKKYAFGAFDASYRVAAVHDKVTQHLLELPLSPLIAGSCGTSWVRTTML